MADNIAALTKAKAMTTAAAQTYVAERIAAAESNGWQALAGGLVLMAINPGDGLRLMAGLTPPLAKAVRAEVLTKSGGNDDAVKLWMADLRKAARLMADVSEAALKADVGNGMGQDADKAAAWLEGLRLTYQGQTVAQAAKVIAEGMAATHANRYQMRLAHKARFEEKRADAAAAPVIAAAPDAAPDAAPVIPAPVSDAAPAQAATPKVRFANLLAAVADMVQHGAEAADVSQKDVAAMAALLARLATERVARRIAAEMTAAADAASAPTAEAEAIAAANAAADAAAPVKGKRPAPVKVKADALPLSNVA